MDSDEYTTRLLKGSENLARMKREINTIILVVVGGVRSLDLGIKNRGFEEVFESGSCKWRVSGKIWCQGDDLLILCRPQGLAEVVVYNTTADTVRTANIPDVAALAVHEDLATLVMGMVKYLPRLEVALKPVIDASQNVAWYKLE